MTDDPSTNSGEWVCLLAPIVVACTPHDRHGPGCGYVTPSPVPDSAECERCAGSGCDINMCDDCGDEFNDPCARHRSFGHTPGGDGYTDGTDCSTCCTDCHPVPDSERPDTTAMRDAAQVIYSSDAWVSDLLHSAADWIDAHRCPTPKGGQLAELRAARDDYESWLRQEGGGVSSLARFFDAVDRLLASHPGGEA